MNSIDKYRLKTLILREINKQKLKRARQRQNDFERGGEEERERNREVERQKRSKIEESDLIRKVCKAL